MIKSIAVPVDGSKYSYKASDYAIELASKFDATLVLIHVLDEASYSSFDALEDNGEEILKKVALKAHEKNIATVEHLITGDALRDMKTIVEKSRADLVVIHRFGKNLFTEDLNLNQIGSVADRLLKTSEIPVLLVK